MPKRLEQTVLSEKPQQRVCLVDKAPPGGPQPKHAYWPKRDDSPAATNKRAVLHSHKYYIGNSFGITTCTQYQLFYQFF